MKINNENEKPLQVASPENLARDIRDYGWLSKCLLYIAGYEGLVSVVPYNGESALNTTSLVGLGVCAGILEGAKYTKNRQLEAQRQLGIVEHDLPYQLPALVTEVIPDAA